MKQVYFIVFFIISAWCLQAQSIDSVINGGFERWNSFAFQDLDYSWVTTNYNHASTYGNVTVSRVNGQSGSAAHFATYLSGNDTVSGFAEYIAAASQVPGELTGYYRCHLAGNDTVWITVAFAKNGNLVGLNVLPIKVSASSFTPFTLNISSHAGTPDTIAIILSMTNLFDSVGVSKSAPGSWLEVDQLAFSGDSTNLKVDDGDFETWLSDTISNPTEWGIAPIAIGNATSGISRSKDHYAGSYSIEIQSVPGSYGPQLTNGKFVTIGNATYTEGGQPFSQEIDTLAGYYKYFPSGNDSAAMQFIFQEQNIQIGYSEHSLKAASSCTYFQVPIHLNRTPDTMQLDISAKSVFSTGQSTLYLDSLYFKSKKNSWIANINCNFNIDVFPNPAQNQLNIRFSGKTPSEFDLKIYNLEGRLIIDKEFNTGSSMVTLPIDQLNAGLYFYEITANGSVVRNKFVKAN